MDERDDYADPDSRTPLVSSTLKRRLRRIGIVTLMLVGLAVIVLLILAVVFPTISDRHYSTHVTTQHAEHLAAACRAYYQHSPDKKYPAKLTDLLKPPGDIGPLVHNPDEAFLDAWGQPFRYALVPNEDGELEPYVWTERTRNGRTKLIGAKYTADGKKVVFGLPED